MSTSRHLRRTAAAALAAATLTLSSCSSSGSGSTTVNLVAYSVPKPAYDALTAAFEKTPAGKGVRFAASYGASGTQSKNVLAGQKADYVAFSLAPDLTKLVPSKVDADWADGPTKGLVSDSVVVLVVRKGNPKHILGWNDLIKPGVKIVTPDPGSSGSAKWNILAAYQQVIAGGGNAADASAFLTQFFSHVVSRASSGSAATTQFLSGTGDVLISYEDEAIAARRAGDPVDYVVPDRTILIQNPAAITTTASKAAQAFLAFTESPAGQAIFASEGFRPVLPGVPAGTVAGANDPSDPFPQPATLITIADLGGWSAVNAKFFGPAGLVTKIEGST